MAEVGVDTIETARIRRVLDRFGDRFPRRVYPDWEKVDDVVALPACEELLTLVALVPLQLFAYHVADRRGRDVDQPRNLAKTVTLE